MEIEEEEPETQEIRKEQVIHWVIPYHPAIAQLKLQKYINEMASYWMEDPTKIVLTWKNQYTNLSNKLRKISSQTP